MAAPGPPAALYETVRTTATTVLQRCTDLQDGTCWDAPGAGNKGVIVWAPGRLACQDSTVFPPGFGLMHRAVLIICYGLFFAWLFFGIAIVSDVFADSVEVITNSTRKVKRRHPRTGEMVEVEERVWNWVVANISLMALGTSAPEILLSIVETLILLGQRGGQLGVSTIVGSAAYNYFIIPVVCTVSLRPGEMKKLQHINVFITTAIWSVWAYIWMYIVLSVTSPNVVSVWEAWVTLAFFVIMLISAYIVDRKPWTWKTWRGNPEVFPDEEAGQEGGAAANGTELGALGSGRTASGRQQHSILYWRMLAVRQMAGESKTPEMLALANQAKSLPTVYEEEMDTLSGRYAEQQQREKAIPEGATKVAFTSLHYSVLEAQGEARVVVRRYDGALDAPLSVAYATKDGTAVAGVDYEAVQGVLRFEAGETQKEIVVPIVDDDMSEPDVTFSVVLTDLKGADAHLVQSSVPVTIADDDEGGMIMFELPTAMAGSEDAYVELPVVRRNGSDGRVTVEYQTMDGPDAVAGTHFQGTKGTLVFESGETQAKIRVPLLTAGSKGNSHLLFKVALSNPLGGAVLGKRAVCRIMLTPGKLRVSKHKDDGSVEGEEKFELWPAYKAQFREAMLPDLDGPDGGDGAWVDLVLHYISITWKLIAAFIPPADWRKAYPAFFLSLVELVGIIYILQEVAYAFGCEVLLSPIMNGITLVAMGTSVPDTFASRMAAIHDDTADAAIGNITGSNSTNVFLGLGLPWIIAAHYYSARGENYNVRAGDLGFTVVVYIAGFVCQTATFFVRRYQGGELGGSLVMQRVLLAWGLFLWVFFLVMSGVVDYRHFDPAI